MTGGAGRDVIRGGPSEDVLVDGNGDGKDDLYGFRDDDTFFSNEGRDRLYGADGADVFVSSQPCEEDRIFGGGDARDNASWAQLRGEEIGETGEFANPANGVKVTLAAEAGEWGDVTRFAAGCEDDSFIKSVEFLEGSGGKDHLQGEGQHNVILGRSGKDKLYGLAGADSLLANNRDPGGETEEEKQDPDETLDCGSGKDVLRYDKPYDNEAFTGGECETRKPSSPAQSSTISGIGSESTAEASTVDIDENVIGAISDPEALPPIALFRLDETAGTTAANWMDEETPGAYEEGVGLNEVGAITDSQSVHLDGEDDYIDLTTEWDPADFELTECGGVESGYAVEMWVKFDQEPASREELFSRSVGGKGFFVYRSSNGELNLTIDNGIEAPTVSSDNPVDDEDWHHVVASITEVTKGCPSLLGEGDAILPPRITLFVDGFGYPLGVSGGSPFPPVTEAAHNIVGAREGEGGFSNWLSATVDDVAIYADTLDEEEVLTHLTISEAPPLSTILVAPTDPEAEDTDEDGVANSVDNCPEASNADQEDTDGDGIGDACQGEADSDEDEVPDEEDNCPEDANPTQKDSDENGVGDACEPE